MKAIVLAAGTGTRLGALTAEKPKTMLEFGGRPLVEHQLAAFRRAGIGRIVIIGGYRDEQLPSEGVVRYRNARFAETNMVETLMEARAELDGDVLITYGDVIFEDRVLRQMMEATADIGVAVDMDWRPYWLARFGNLETDVETLEMAPGGRITRIGQPNPTPEQLHGRYVGMIRLSARGAEIVKDVYDRTRAERLGGPWQTSKTFEKGYMTDLLQELVDRGHRVDAIGIERGWLEFDTVEDVARATAWASSGALDRFCRIEGERGA